ncbi:polysaccharide export outer membrane protein [Brevundimonas bullata]|jgi:protein involved in polysaccharide export with SLBB domain|uniref:Polysaccharide export outer membrane protein n=1 Tax=Brevundimonas bullata TaxID=13160 RepID=A0A7W7IP51_9CAUL|nr:polysaccharide biosynthesis/export family protein [Brevundimonas bullata]MBB4797936.1 polysaccharide export outer membrane protein [Brevundimonas bullata]MBB6382895.1 polysaccharide export outer membrane protein [Brevundimonas bullata]
MIPDRRLVLMGLAAGLTGCASAPSSDARRIQGVPASQFPEVPFADWTDIEPEYVLYPGDEIEVATPTAGELTRQLKVGPDGRVSLPLLGHVMAADRTLSQLEGDISAGYATQLRRPEVEVTLRLAGPLKVWVDGEVRNPGVFDMPGDIDAYQAVIMAGGALPTAKTQQAALIRRGPGGVRMMRVVDLRPRQSEVVALRRGDIIFLPRTTLGELAAFFTQVRAAMPIGFSYSLNGGYAST